MGGQYPDDSISLKRAFEEFRSGRLEDAQRSCAEMIERKPQFADAHHLLGLVYNKCGDDAKAIEHLETARRMAPAKVSVYGNLGKTFAGMGRFEEAKKSYLRAIELKPDSAELCNDLGGVLSRLKENSEALKAYRAALKLRPNFAPALNNIGVIYLDEGEYENAIGEFEKALEIDSRYFHARLNIGDALMKWGKLDEAIASYREAARIHPEEAETYNKIGHVYLEKGDLSEAGVAYQEALKMDSSFAFGYNNLGIVMQEMGRFPEAVECFVKAIELSPKYASAFYNLGSVYFQTGALEKSIDAYKTAVKESPESEIFQASLLDVLINVCAWDEARELGEKVDAATAAAIKEGRRTGENPFMNLYRHANPKLNFDVAESWAREISEKARKSGALEFSHAKSRRNEKIRLGYLSRDFREHPMSHLIAGVFEEHDAGNFEVFGYSYGPEDTGNYRKRIAQCCSQFRDIETLNNRAAAQRIFDDRIDILVDLQLHMPMNRMGVFALRPAPIQVSYLGFAGTSGVDFINYVIADKIVTPLEEAHCFSEKLVFMPDTYMPSDRRQPVSNEVFERKSLNLPEEDFVYCSFNRPVKIDPSIFDAWMRILKRVPRSVLWLIAFNELAKKNLMKETELRGVSVDRVRFAERLPIGRHIKRISLADLALDTMVCSGGTTTVDTLRGGVPVLAVRGGNFISRMSTSLLNAFGLPELVVENLDEYVERAVELAHSPGKLKEIKRSIEKNRVHAPLFDTVRYTRNLERGYRIMWERLQRGESPAAIDLGMSWT